MYRRRETYPVYDTAVDEADGGQNPLERDVRTAWVEEGGNNEPHEEQADVPYRYSISKLPAWLQRRVS